MAPNAQNIVALLERALTVPAPIESLATLAELRHELDELERTHVARALQAGDSYADIARPLGISRQAAHRRYRHLTVAEPDQPAQPRLTADARAALIRARAEATRHGSRSIDPRHLLLALAPRGLDVEAARRSFGPPAINAPAPAGLHPSLHARLVRTDGPLQLDHLLRAALEDPASQQLMQRFG
jgi:transposase-like protein